MPREDPDADEDGGHLPQRAARGLGRDLTQVHGERAEGDACGGSMRRESAVSFTADAGRRTSFCFALDKKSAVTRTNQCASS